MKDERIYGGLTKGEFVFDNEASRHRGMIHDVICDTFRKLEHTDRVDNQARIESGIGQPDVCYAGCILASLLRSANELTILKAAQILSEDHDIEFVLKKP